MNALSISLAKVILFGKEPPTRIGRGNKELVS